MDEKLNTVEAGKFLGVEPRTLEAWRYRGEGPRYVRYNQAQIRYLRSDLEEFVRRSTVVPPDVAVA